MKVEAVLLDMGGVLLDMRGTNGVPKGQADFRGRQAVSRLVGGRPRLVPEDLDRVVFEPWQRQYRRRYQSGREADILPFFEDLRRLGGAAASAEELLAGWFGPFADSLRPLPGAVEAVETVRGRGFEVALISNVPLPGALYRQVLERYGFDRHIAIHRFSYDSGHRKPSPYMLRSALAEAGVAAAAAVMVGDRKASDVAAGRAAGTATIWIRSAHSDGPEPDWTISTIGDLPALLDQVSE